MFKISDLYSNLLRKPLSTDCGIGIEALNAEIALLNRQLLDDRISFFSFNIIFSGNATLLYDGNTVRLEKNNLFISAPGVRIYTQEVSDDYSGLCLVIEEDTIYEIPYARNVLSASYMLANPLSKNKLLLSESDLESLVSRIEDMQQYIQANHPYKKECLYSLYTVFSLDLLNLEKKTIDDRRISSVTSELFIRLLKLMRENFIDHHNIEFYSDALSVTSIYLSRIVKMISGQTVKAHLDRLLMMEAKFLLLRTNLAVSRIAERLNFANPASFCRFFSRHQGMSPKEYRIRN